VAPAQRVNVMAFLADKPLAAALVAARAPGAAPRSVPWSAEQQRAYSAALKAKQAPVISAAQALGGQVVGQLTNASNGVLLSIDANQLGALARVADVQSVMVVEDMALDLSSVTAYVGATALHGRSPSVDGTGVRIAILDSGIDFTHRNLGGAGTLAAYAAAYGAAGPACVVTTANTTAPTWTSKVIGGFDFVGERWPNTSPVLEPDPNPIDCQGHGTNVADIAGGRSADGTWKGMAPGAQLLASRSARLWPRAARAWASCRAWTTCSTRTRTATCPTRSKWSTCRWARTSASARTRACCRRRTS
jgi:subtilisin family serine protease